MQFIVNPAPRLLHSKLPPLLTQPNPYIFSEQPAPGKFLIGILRKYDMAIFIVIVHVLVGILDLVRIVHHSNFNEIIIKWGWGQLVQLSSFDNLKNIQMSRRYDSRTTTFTPDGRLQQIEYAVEAINKTGSSIGVVTRQGVVLATEKHEASFLLEESKISEKIYAIDKHVFCVVSGLSADANYLINLLRENAQDYRVKYRSSIPIEEIVVYICDIKQYYTQIGGSRPFGAAFLFAGYDKHGKFQLYSTDPSGNYAGWKATAIGSNHVAANSFLKQEYKEEMSQEEGLGFALKALVKTMETTTPSPKKIELVSISFTMDDQIQGINLSEDRIKDLLRANGLTVEEKKEE